MLLRSHRAPFQRGGHRRHRRPQRLREEQYQRCHQLGPGRAVGQEPARRPHGGRDLRRHARPQAARHGLRHHDAGGPRRLQRERGAQAATRGGRHPPKNAEITITRRLYRSGESEYLIDGRSARLRDIQDLFMGTGLGPESYAIIEQGRIGQILSSKPQDRRAVIEEAAGITKFKTRKRLAEAKLEGAKQNLARVYDILEEVTRQVNSLKRQASKAKRYGELKIELDTRLRVVLGGKYRLLERDAAKTAHRSEHRRRRIEGSRRPGGGARAGAREPAGGLLRSRVQAHRSAPATRGAAGGSGADARTSGLAGEGKRLHRAAHRAEREGDAGTRRAPGRARRRRSAATRRMWRRSKRRSPRPASA